MRFWLAGLLWKRYVRSKRRPAPVPPLWAIRWVMAGSDAQRAHLADTLFR
jgi:hypothetical protein